MAEEERQLQEDCAASRPYGDTHNWEESAEADEGHITLTRCGGGVARASPQMNRFWRRLGHASKDGSFIQLAWGSSLMGTASLGSVLYVRSCYLRMLKIVNTHFHQDRHVQGPMVITGTSGTGKTHFLYFLMFQLCRAALKNKAAQPTILMQPQGNKLLSYLFRPGEVLVGRPACFAAELQQESTWLLIDDQEGPSSCAAKTILSAMPHEALIKPFKKVTGYTIRYMPLCSLAEILIMRAKLYPQLSQHLVAQLFCKWDGRPRLVLQFATDRHWQAGMERAAQACAGPLALLMQLVNRASARSNACDMLFKMVPVGCDFKDVDVRWTSDEAMDLVRGALHEDEKQLLDPLLAASTSQPLLAAMHRYVDKLGQAASPR